MTKLSARGIVLKDGCVLLIYRENHNKIYYSIPGGKVDIDETLKDTVVREVLEETSIKVKPVEFLGSFNHTKKNKQQNLFLCEYLNGEPKLGQSTESEKMSKNPANIYKPLWVDCKIINKLTIMPTPTSTFFKNYISKKINTLETH